MSAQSTRKIFINHRPYMIGPTQLTGEALASLVGVPRDNVVVEVETSSGLRTVALDEALSTDDGPSFLVTRQFIMGGMS